MCAHLLVDRRETLERRGGVRGPEAVADAAVGRERDLDAASRRLRLGRQAGDDGDRELETLGCVHGHDPDRVGVGLGKDGLRDASRLRGLQPRPPQVPAEVAAGAVGPCTGLVDHEAQPAPDLTVAPVDDAEFVEATVAGDAVEHRRRAGPRALFVTSRPTR